MRHRAFLARPSRAAAAPRRRSPVAFVTAGLAIVLAVGLTAGCGTPHPSTGRSGGVAIGVTVFPTGHRQRLPDVVASTLSGSRLSLRSVAGHGVLVVNVWASWCTECRAESPALGHLAARLRGRDVRFVGIDEQDSAGAARSYARSTGMTYPHLEDPDGTVLAKLSVLPSVGIPSTLVVDRGSRMAARIIGATTATQLQSIISSIDA